MVSINNFFNLDKYSIWKIILFLLFLTITLALIIRNDQIQKDAKDEKNCPIIYPENDLYATIGGVALVLFFSSAFFNYYNIYQENSCASRLLANATAPASTTSL